jgi:coenzyme F420 hydrogenase subunit beta
LSSAGDLESIVANGLCLGCGLCASLAGGDGIEMAITSFGQIRPQARHALSPALMAAILEVCPGVTLTGPERDPDGEAVMHPIWGLIGDLYRGWAADEPIRFRAAAGGMLTALGVHLLRSGKVDAVLHVKASIADPVLTDAWVSTTVAEVVEGAQSRYGPAAPLVHVHRLLAEGKRFAVIGKPCDCSAIRNLAAVDARVREQIPYLLTLFCGGVPTTHMAHKFAASRGLTPEQIALFRWRGEGWPGMTHIESTDGRVFEIDYDTAWFDSTVPWTYDIQFRCKICPDAIGEAADVSCPDGWVMEDGKPIHREAPGINVVLPRTAAGRRLIAEAAAAGDIHLEPFTLAELDLMHADHYQRKLENPGRLLGLAIARVPRPRFRRYRLLATLLRAGLPLTWREFLGTFRRLRRGANLEPLA